MLLILVQSNKVVSWHGKGGQITKGNLIVLCCAPFTSQFRIFCDHTKQNIGGALNPKSRILDITIKQNYMFRL